MFASAMPVGTGGFRMCKCIPLSKLSLTFSHATLVVVGSACGPNEASTVIALRWSLRNASILQDNDISPHS